jgi:hypothetical protein
MDFIREATYQRTASSQMMIKVKFAFVLTYVTLPPNQLHLNHEPNEQPTSAGGIKLALRHKGF